MDGKGSKKGTCATKKKNLKWPREEEKAFLRERAKRKGCWKFAKVHWGKVYSFHARVREGRFTEGKTPAYPKRWSRKNITRKRHPGRNSVREGRKDQEDKYH